MQAVAQPYSLQGHNVRMSASAGVSIYPEHGEDAMSLLKIADLALFEAKRAGKNDYRIGTRPGSAGEWA